MMSPNLVTSNCVGGTDIKQIENLEDCGNLIELSLARNQVMEIRRESLTDTTR